MRRRHLRQTALVCLAGLFAFTAASVRAEDQTLPVSMFRVPAGTHNRESGYTAVEVGHDGRVYVGTALYGGSGSLVAFDPADSKWEKLFDVHALSREKGTGLNAQAKLHAKLLVGDDGVVWSASKQGNEDFSTRPEYGEDPTGYPGGRLISYHPDTGLVVDHGILLKQNGLMGGSIDQKRRRLYYWGDPKQQLLRYDIDDNRVTLLGHIGGSPRYTAIDPSGRVFGVGRPGIVWMYDPEADQLYDLRVQVADGAAYRNPYVMMISADGKQLLGAAIGGSAVFTYDLASIQLNDTTPGANGTITCVPSGSIRPGDQHAGVIGQDGCFYICNDKELWKFDPRTRVATNLGVLTVTNIPDQKIGTPQGAAIDGKGGLWLKYIYPYSVLRVEGMTTAK